VDPDVWNRLVPATHLFNRHHFLLALEQSKVEDADMEYLLFWENGTLAASAVLSKFYINLDLFIGDNQAVRLIKRIFPNFFKIKVLFCGTPISAGHKNVYMEGLYQSVIKLSAEYIDQVCRRNDIGYSVYKEFLEAEATTFEQLTAHGYFRAPSLPSVAMELPFLSYDEYFGALRHPFRRQINLSMKKINSVRPVFVQSYFEGNQDERHPVFTILSSVQLSAEKFYELYISVMSRATVKLEVLNKQFFRNFFISSRGEIRILTMVFRGEILGVFLLSCIKDELTFIWTGKDSHKDQYDTYANLMNAMVCYAIAERCTKIIMGQTSYYPKQRVGGSVFPLFIFFKSHRWNQRLLRLLKPLIFPETTTDKLKTFKCDIHSRERERCHAETSSAG
jgi:hypothetical protein